jgi:hypothetical protein
MLIQADYDFLTLQRLQKAQFQAKIFSDISETSSQPELEDDKSEIEEIEIENEHIEENTILQDEIKKIEVCETELSFEKEENVLKETSPIEFTIQQKQEKALELLKNAFEQIKLALSILDNQTNDVQKLNQEIEIISQSVIPKAAEIVIPKAAEIVIPKAAEIVIPKAAEIVIPKAAEIIIPKAVEIVIPKAAEIVIPKAAEIVIPNAAEIVIPKAAEIVIPKAAEIVIPKAAEIVIPKTKKQIVPKAEEVVALMVTKSIVNKPSEVVSPKAKKMTIQKVPEIIAPKKEKEIHDEFQVVMPKKSKNKSATIILQNITSNVESKEEFPILGGSFSPIQQVKGFWETGKSIEIANKVAPIPSPPPTRSPILTVSRKVRTTSRGPIEDNDYSEDELKYRKNGDDIDDTYWQ